MSLTIAFRISDQLELNRFISLFAAVPARLKHAWKITGLADASVVVVDANEPGTNYFLETCRKSSAALPLVYADSNWLRADWFLAKPVRAASLVDVLNSIGARLQAPDKPAAPATKLALVQAPESANDTFIPQPVCAWLDTTQRTRHARVMLQDEPVFYIDRTEQQVALPVDRLINRSQPQLSRLDFRNHEQFKLEELGAIDWQQQAQDECILMGFDAFRWLVYQSLSDGKLHPALNENSNVKLAQFPNFSQLPHSPAHVLLASYLIKQGGNLATIVERTKLQRDMVVAFINASHAIGILHVQQSLFGNMTMSSGQDRHLVSKLFKRIFG
jgi:hypothetical protein